MNNPELSALYLEHGDAKARMTRGIVFIVVSYVLLFVGCFFYGMGLYILPLLLVAVLFFLACIPFEVVGIIYLVTGIIRRCKATKKINQAKAAAAEIV